MEKSFEEALGDLLAEYHETDPDELMSALESQLYALESQPYALKEQHPGG